MTACRCTGSASRPFFIFAADVPDSADAYLVVGAFQNDQRAIHARQHRMSSANHRSRCLLDIHQDQPRVGDARRLDRPCHRHCHRARRPAELGTRRPRMTFSGVASNFAGVPLAFAFLATLGRLGLVTVLPEHLVRHRHLRARLQPPVLLGPDAYLSLSSRSR